VQRALPGPRPRGAGRAFRALPGQVGFVAARGDRVVGLELLGSPWLFAHCFSILMDFYPGALADDDAAPAPCGFDAPEPFLEALLRAEASARPTAGLGSELWLCGEGLAGSALVAGALVHLLAFPTPGLGAG
jgi:hypothetical protein